MAGIRMSVVLHAVVSLIFITIESTSLYSQDKIPGSSLPVDSIASSLYAEGNYWKLMEFSKQFNVDTLSAKFQFALGMSYAALSESQRGLEFLKRALILDSSKLQYRFQYAKLLSQTGLFTEAIEQLNRCIALDSNYIPARFQLGLTYAARKKDPEQEMAIFSSLIERNPNDFLSHYYLADALKRFGKPDSAAIYLQFSLRSNPRYLPALIAFSNYLSGQKRYRDALPVYLKADSVRGNNKDLLFQIGECYRKLNQLPMAKQYFKKAMVLDSMNGLYHAQLAYTFFSAGEFNSSVAEYQQAILYDEENAPYYLNLALAYKKLNMTSMVIQTYKSAITVRHPELTSFIYNDIAAFCSEKELWRETVDAYQRSLDINPGQTEIVFFLGNAYAQLSENQNAIHTLNRYLQLTRNDSTKTEMRAMVQRNIDYLKKQK